MDLDTDEDTFGVPERKDFIKTVLQGIGDDYSEYMEFFMKLNRELRFSLV